MYYSKKIYYFEKAGEANTENVIKFALERAFENHIGVIVVPTETGRSALLIKKYANQMNYTGDIIAVRYHTGFGRLNEQFMDDNTYNELISMGVKIHTGTHLFSSVSRSFRIKWDGLYMPEIVGETLKIFGNGMKTAIEVAVMAANGGLIKDITQDIVSLGGTNSGLDTGIVLRTGYQNNFLDYIKIREIICRPIDY